MTTQRVIRRTQLESRVPTEKSRECAEANRSHMNKFEQKCPSGTKGKPAVFWYLGGRSLGGNFINPPPL